MIVSADGLSVRLTSSRPCKTKRGSACPAMILAHSAPSFDDGGKPVLKITPTSMFVNAVSMG